MRNSDGKMMKRGLSVILITVFVVSISFLLGRALTPVTYADYFNHDMKQLEEKNESVDLLFVGDSRVYSSIDARIMEERLGLNNVVVAATSSQPVCGTYYLVKDLSERLKPKKIILSLDYDLLIEDAKIQPMLLCMDRLSFQNRISMWNNCFFGRDKLYLADIYRYRENLDDLFAIAKDRKQLIEDDYIDRAEGDDYYCYKGYIYRNGSCATGNIPIQVKGVFAEERFLDENVGYLDACIELCKEKGIQLELFSAPTTMMRVYYVQNFGDAVRYYENYAAEKGLIYHNLNYLKNREDFLPDELMCDYNHTNGDGAKVISNLYADILIKEGKGEDVSDYFYADFDELCRDITRVTAVEAKIEKKEDGVRFNMKSTHGIYTKPLYQIEIENKDGTYEVLSSWSSQSDQTLILPEGFDGSIRVSARNSENFEKIAYQVYHLND